MRVYRYACKVRGDPSEVYDAQIRLANRMWNDLVAIHRRYQERRQEIRAHASADVEALEAERARLLTERDELRAALKRARQSSRGRVPAPARLAEIGAALRALKEPLKTAREEARESILPALREVDASENAEVEALRVRYQGLGLYWGTIADILQVRWPAARKRRLPDGRPAELRFHRYDGSGTLTVLTHQAEGGEWPATWRGIREGKYSAVRIIDPKGDPPEPVLRNGRPVCARRRDPATGELLEERPVYRRRLPVLRLQVRAERAKGADGWVRLEPAWVEAPIIIHREPPPDAWIVRVQLVRERVAGRWEYAVCVTADEDAPTRETGPRVALDIGWRVLPDGRQRAGYWLGEDGQGGEVEVPASVLERLEKAESIRAIRDRILNEAKAALDAWARDRERATLPGWLADAVYGHPERPVLDDEGRPVLREDGSPVVQRAGRPLMEWRSAERLAALTVRWRDERFPGDEGGFGPLEAWRKRDGHLWRYETGLRRGAERHRLHAYRDLAARLAERYAEAVVERFDLRELARLPAPEAGAAGEGRAQRHASRTAAPSALRGALVQAFAARGGHVIQASAEWTTRRCAGCGEIVPADYAAEVMVRCPACGAWYDQDTNACRNLLALAASDEAAPENPGSLAEGGGRRGKPTRRERWSARQAEGRAGEAS